MLPEAQIFLDVLLPVLVQDDVHQGFVALGVLQDPLLPSRVLQMCVLAAPHGPRVDVADVVDDADPQRLRTSQSSLSHPSRRPSDLRDG